MTRGEFAMMLFSSFLVGLGLFVCLVRIRFSERSRPWRRSDCSNRNSFRSEPLPERTHFPDTASADIASSGRCRTTWRRARNPAMDGRKHPWWCWVVAGLGARESSWCRQWERSKPLRAATQVAVQIVRPGRFGGVV
ncbi:hypothetical protein P168DRAFT_139715 [Aspergillus campestris IBT 28561]|uniref:Uncharacterized protein n=1 Tax=Aspergillus campestris (strain IBT 28561) TaxID=1392248 RepID=A0A2I1D4J6_ASPC2|nr:uncharacterized protein P168DRAFT_139715 [Aspergillus campestris IBT 28561]PKY04807.1 hypothetical protein P168DRAFT_139715 [Aspergillus campestris IBT 28561]